MTNCNIVFNHVQDDQCENTETWISQYCEHSVHRVLENYLTYFVESAWLKVVWIPQSKDIKRVLRFTHDMMKKINMACWMYSLNRYYSTGSTWKGSLQFFKIYIYISWKTYLYWPALKSEIMERRNLRGIQQGFCKAVNQKAFWNRFAIPLWQIKKKVRRYDKSGEFFFLVTSHHMIFPLFCFFIPSCICIIWNFIWLLCPEPE